MTKSFSFKFSSQSICLLISIISFSLNNEVAKDIEEFGKGTSIGLVSALVGNEISGLVSSRQLSDVLWVHNDSGDSAKIYAINSQGEHLATVNLRGAKAFDYEDIAIDAQNRLYVADIGDNAKIRESIQIYRFEEPIDIKSSIDVTPEVINLYYPDRSHNAETLFIDPIDGSLYVLTKTRKENSLLFKVQPPLTGSMKLEKVQSFNFNGELTTAGDISPNGKLIMIRTYDHIYIWRRPIENSIVESMDSQPISWPVQTEKQGEAVAFTANGENYLTISEGNTQSIFLYPNH